MGRFKEHGVLIYLSNPLYIGFVKLQADKGLGRSFAALLPFVEGLYAMGYITKEVYEEHQKRYSQPLITQKPLKHFTEDQATQLNKTLAGVYEQWKEHPNPKWRNGWLNIARQHPELSNSKKILALEQKVKP